MKNLKNFLLSVLATLLFTQLSFAQSKFDKWPELKSFHGVMSQTFHPSEEGNLQPIKTRSLEMVNKADSLSKSNIPAEFNKKEVKEAINKLVIDSKKLHELIQNKGNDEEIKKSLSNLHDTFHLIVEKCSHTDEHH